MKKIKVGLIGLGEVAQLIHLPVLHKLQQQFSIAAIHDVSPSVMAGVGQRWNIVKHYGEVGALLADKDIDAVFILSPDQYHGQHARTALMTGKHVFIEKPVCLTKADLEELIACEKSSNRLVMVGYMRRFAPAFIAAKQQLATFGSISYVRVRDIICEGPWFFRQTDDVITPQNDVPAEISVASRALREKMMGEMCGTDAPAMIRRGYEVMTGLSSHSLSAMRDLLGGSPRRVIGARLAQGGEQLTALLDYGGHTALYECLIDDIARFDAGIEVLSRTKRLSFKYDTPYLRHLPMSLTLQETTTGSNVVHQFGPFYTDPFQCELVHFYACVTGSETNRTPPSDSLADLDLFADILQACKNSLAV